MSWSIKCGYVFLVIFSPSGRKNHKSVYQIFLIRKPWDQDRFQALSEKEKQNGFDLPLLQKKLQIITEENRHQIIEDYMNVVDLSLRRMTIGDVLREKSEETTQKLRATPHGAGDDLFIAVNKEI